MLRRYATVLLIYSAAFAAVTLLLDWALNGVVANFLSEHDMDSLLYFFWSNRTMAILVAYLLGVGVVSAGYVVRLSRLLSAAVRAIREEEPKIFQKNCPYELQDFSRSLKDFQFELKQNEQARALAEQQKNDLVVYLAHDLKTPLTSVIGYLDLLAEGSDLPVEMREKYIGIALDKAYRLENLINEFFDITRLNLQTIPTQKSPVRLTVLLHQIVNEFYPMCQENRLTIEADIQPDLRIDGDADKLARVFDNLFRNAVSYSDPDTTVSCRAYAGDNSVVVVVQNRGDTIPPHQLERIFDKFYRVDAARRSATGGTGLGLSFAKQIVELHGGSISVTSRDGLTAFTVTLPMS